MSSYPPSADFAEPSGPADPSPPLRGAVLTLFWLTAAASAAVTVSTFARRGAWQESFDAGNALVDDLTTHDVPVIIAVFVLTMLVVTSAIAVAVWSMRLVACAQARGVSGLSPGWAVGGWFVPVGFLALGFRQVAKAVAGVGGSTTRVVAWQAAFAAAALVTAVAQFTSRDISAVPTESAVSALTRESVLSLASTVLLIASAATATLAVRHADATIERVGVGRQRNQTGRLDS
jgi:hypothetical protein